LVAPIAPIAAINTQRAREFTVLFLRIPAFNRGKE
jgi:hypothetical protein